jgi:hypothetical protein
LSPRAFTLEQNYPNPFNASTEIRFELAREANVSLRIYDIAGREVVTLLDGMTSAGSHGVKFDGAALGSGIYFYRLETGGRSDTRKMILLK